MTLHQQVQAALMRAQYCKTRRKASTPHYAEAAKVVGLILAHQNQRKGYSYTQAQLASLRGPRRAKPIPLPLFERV